MAKGKPKISLKNKPKIKLERSKWVPEQVENEAYASLLYAVIEKAVEDYRALSEAKMIINDKSISNEEWPRNEKDRILKFVGYDREEKVNELIYFLTRGYLEKLLVTLDSQISASAIRQKLGIKPGKIQ